MAHSLIETTLKESEAAMHVSLTAMQVQPQRLTT